MTVEKGDYTPYGLKCDVSRVASPPEAQRRTSRRPQGARLLPPLGRGGAGGRVKMFYGFPCARIIRGEILLCEIRHDKTSQQTTDLPA